MGAPGEGGRSDRDLVLAFQAGHPGAYEEVYRRHRGRVHRVCNRLLGNQQDVEEAVQETFLKAYQALPRFNGQFQLGAWLTRIATNVCVDHLRSRSRSHLVALPDDDVAEGDRGPEEAIVGEHPRLDQALNEIQPLHARALTLRAVEGLSHREIAGHLAMTPPQVKALLHRARRSLRRAWDNAQAWTLAPLVTLRAVFGRSEPASQAGTHMVWVTPQLPALVEKVAASAVLVVVVLSGTPSIVHDDDHAGRTGVSATGPVETRGRIEGRQLKVAAPLTEEPAEAPEDASLLDDLTDTVTVAVEGQGGADPESERGSRNRGGGGDDGVPASVKGTTNKAREVVVKTFDSVSIDR